MRRALYAQLQWLSSYNAETFHGENQRDYSNVRPPASIAAMRRERTAGRIEC